MMQIKATEARGLASVAFQNEEGSAEAEPSSIPTINSFK